MKTGKELPKVKPAKVLSPEYNEAENTIYIPLVPLDHTRTRMDITICWFLMEHGYTLNKVRETISHIPEEWTKRAIYANIREHGPARYPEGRRI